MSDQIEFKKLNEWAEYPAPYAPGSVGPVGEGEEFPEAGSTDFKLTVTHPFPTPLVAPTSTYDSRPDTYEHIAQVRRRLNDAAMDLVDRGEVHDQSKLEDPERSMFDAYTPLLRDVTYGSDEYHTYRSGMGAALQHHYEHNDHHPEHFANGWQDMNLLQVIEMLCDWIAASQRHTDGDVRKSVEVNQERFGYSDDFKRLLHNTLDYWGVEK